MINIDQKIKEAMLSKNALELSVLRALKTEVTKFLSTKGRNGKPLTQDEEWNLIRAAIRQREDSIEQFKAVKRWMEVDKELSEREILKSFLPEPISDLELETLISLAIAETEATTRKDTGKVIAHLNANTEIAGRFDMKIASRTIAEKLK